MIPKPLTLRKEDYKDAPAWTERLFAQLNEWLGVTTSALTGALTRADNMASRVKTIAFTSDTVVSVKHGLGKRASDVWLGRLRRADGAAITAAYSMTWDHDGSDGVKLRFQGLVAATRYEARIIVE